MLDEDKSEHTLKQTAWYYVGRVLRLLDKIEDGKRDVTLKEVVLLKSLEAFLRRIAENDDSITDDQRAEMARTLAMADENRPVCCEYVDECRCFERMANAAVRLVESWRA